MSFRKLFEHEHPLKLIDLHLENANQEEEYDEEDDDLITKEEFRSSCDVCSQEIHMYHRYYYKCTDSSCDFSLHKFCADIELTTTLEHLSHHHPLTLARRPSWWGCVICYKYDTHLNMFYECDVCCFSIHANCAVNVEKKVIYHPSHPHLLTCLIPKPIICKCSACGEKHKGVFHQCTTCVGFAIHTECAFLPKTLLIHHRTDGAFHHTHPLTISYSFPIKDQRAYYFPRCRVCRHDFERTYDLWIYKCDKCMYYVHMSCAVRVPPAGAGKTIQNYKDVEHPGLLHLPFPDETYSLPKHLFFQEISDQQKLVNHLTHASHQHPLILVDQTQCNQQTSSLLLLCHNPMKKTQLLCNGCLRPIMSTMPFYICVENCNNFALHEWCTRLPQKIDNHPAHPQHTLLLIYSNVSRSNFGVFYCDVCWLPCNGFAYCCVECNYCVDASCGFVPRQITHEAHPNHLLSLDLTGVTYIGITSGSCHICLRGFINQMAFGCRNCNLYIHVECALFLAKTIRHKYDKHPMHLSYLPIENHKSDYFCEICEEYLNPHESFYHCKDCTMSVHTACAPLILQCETDTYVKYRKSVYHFLNIKFGGIHDTDAHPHPFSFSQGIVSDGQCSRCGEGLQYKMIFKCLMCKFAIDYDCYERLNKV